MVIPGNDIKSFCRSALINSLSSSPTPEPVKPVEPGDWKYPEDWLQLENPGQNEIKALIGSNSLDRDSITDACYTTRVIIYNSKPEASGTTICSINWGDGNSIDVVSGQSGTDIHKSGETYYVKHKYEQGSGHTLNDVREQWILSIDMKKPSTHNFITSNEYSSSNYEMSTMMLKMGSSTFFSEKGNTKPFFKKNYLLEYIKVSGLMSNCFDGCKKLKQIEFTNINSIQEIPSSCFMDCDSLEKIKLEKIKSFGTKSFYGCSSLSYVSFKPSYSEGISETFGHTPLENVEKTVIYYSS